MSIYIYDVSISGFTRSSIYIYIYDISSLRVNNQLTLTLSLQRIFKRSKLVISNSPLEMILKTYFLKANIPLLLLGNLDIFYVDIKYHI